jgi:C4-dicarboxylate-specific signal transduction histidine kinase
MASLLGRIKRAEEALQKARDELEQRVAARTVKLHQANEKLKAEGAERGLADEELRRSRDKLEVRVQERTAELAQRNEELTVEIAERLKVEQSLQESKEQLRILASRSSPLRRMKGNGSPWKFTMFWDRP